MSFQVIVREIKLTDAASPVAGASAEQVYEQTVASLDLGKVIAAVNFKPRVRKPRAPAAGATR